MLYLQGSGAGDGTRCCLNHRAACGHTRSQATSGDGGDRRGARSPGGGAGQVLMAAVGVVAGGGELLLLPGGDGGIRRGHGDGNECGRRHRQAGGTADGARGCLNHRAACGHTGGHSTSGDGGDRRGTRGPGRSAGQVLVAAVAVVAGGGELLLLPGGNRRIGRSHGNGDKCGCCDGQAGGTADGARGCLNHRAACGHTGDHSTSGDGGDGWSAGGPSGGAGQVLMTAVAVVTGGGELLLLPGGNRRLGRSHGDGNEFGRGGGGQAGGTADGARGCLRSEEHT